MSGPPVVVVREPGRSALFVIVREPFEIGRGGSGLLVDDPRVSRHHLELRPDGADGVIVEDLGSANGTTLDGRLLSGAEKLGPGATLRIGDTIIKRAPSSTWGEGTVTIVFSDIESSTAQAQSYGDARWFEILAAHNEIVRHALAAHGGEEVKAQGDGFMLAFSSARNAVRCMIQVQREITAMGRSAPDPAIRIRFGAHTGEAIVDDDGDLFGYHVNAAARIADQADGGEILVSSLVREIVEARGDLRFGEPRTARLKGFSGEWTMHPVLWDTDLDDDPNPTVPADI